MKHSILLAAAFLYACIFQACSSQPSAKKTDTTQQMNAGKNGFAVVELFTSQGCSSCPPADKLLDKLAAQYQANGQVFIPLSFHVDYWDRLGWKDPFSQHIFSERQTAYSGQMHLESVYTPQAVINGVWETVGSKASQLQQFIQKGFEQKSNAVLEIETVIPEGLDLKIAYRFKNDGLAIVLHFAIVQNKATTEVKAGENDGQTLQNINIVRSWKSAEAAGADTQYMLLPVPEGYNETAFSVIVLAQEKASGKIIAVSKK